MARFFLSHKERISSQSHFDYVYNNDSTVRFPFGVLCYALKQGEDRHVAFVASKWVGNSVQRSVATRRFKELFRLNQHRINKRYDLIFKANQSLLTMPVTQCEALFVAALQEVGLWLEI